MSSNLKRPKLAFIVSRFPYPLEKGDKLRAFYQIKELAKTHDIHLIALSEKKISQEHIDLLQNFCQDVTVFRLKWWMILLQLSYAMFSKRPFQVAYFYDPFVASRINKILGKLQPDHIFCQLIRASEYVKDYHQCPKTLDYMDAFSKGIERRIEKAPFHSRWLFRTEARRLGQYERSIFSYFEHKLIISEQDRDLILHPERNKIICIPNGIDNSFFSPVTVKQEFDLVFVGNLSYAPNVEAVSIIAQILKKLPGKTCLISGANPSATVKKIAGQNASITLKGWVEDIRESYCSGKIFIAPMMIGTGMQNKLLEAMALGIPCVTTPLAGNAIHAENGVQLIMADNTDTFVAAINNLLQNRELSNQLSIAGVEFVRSNFSWEHSTDLIRKHCLMS